MALPAARQSWRDRTLHGREATRIHDGDSLARHWRGVHRYSRPTLLIVALACATTLMVNAAPEERRARTAAHSTVPREVRALWVTRTSLVSPADVARVVRDAQRYGFNTLLVQVRGRGDAYFNESIEPRAESLAAQPTAFDPLEELIAAAHPLGLEVHAWISVNLAASATTLPTSRTHVVHAHPEWLMVPRALVATLGPIDPHRPEYVQRLAQWTRAHNRTVEGLFVSPIPVAAAAYTSEVVADLVRRYAVDGVHLDYIRYPNAEFDYSPAALDAFRAEMLPTLETETRTRLDTRREVAATAYADAFPDRWAAFRRARLTSLVEQLAGSVRTLRPNVLVSAAVIPDPREASDHRLQEWTVWLASGLVNVVCPMMYTSSAQRFAAQADLIREAAGAAVWAGIGAWQLSPAETVRRIDAARARRFAGVALFSYDSLAARRQAFLATVDRQAFQAATGGAPGSR
ncbi:MAG: family 10 glycosylhydrolase [Luteitalea sp.]|nr:family 10 glycosylhydrolase [Luteitalea sp.]